jgi:hydrogenase maturation protease
MSERVPLLVLGLGNALLEDDGVGSAAVSLLLDRFEPPAGARVFDGGTLGLSLLPYLDTAEAVILVDAIRSDGAPGGVVRLEGGDVGPAVASRLSPHQVGVADLLDGARWLGRYPGRVVLLGLNPASMNLAVGLSPLVHASLPTLVERIVDEARTLGFVFTRRYRDEAPAADRTVDVARLAGMR